MPRSAQNDKANRKDAQAQGELPRLKVSLPAARRHYSLGPGAACAAHRRVWPRRCPQKPVPRLPIVSTSPSPPPRDSAAPGPKGEGHSCECLRNGRERSVGVFATKASKVRAPFALQCLSGINPLPISKEQDKSQQIRILILMILTRPITPPLTCVFQIGCRDLSQLIAHFPQIPNRIPVNFKPRRIEIRHPARAQSIAPDPRLALPRPALRVNRCHSSPPHVLQLMASSNQHSHQPSAKQIR